ncbi:MAG: hypothetical protein ACXU9C_20610 [Xanthobacteraceae bacterium]
MIAALLARLAPYKLIAECLAIGALIAYVAFQAHEFCMHEQQIGYDRAKAEQAALDKVRNEAQAKIDAALNKRVTDAEGKADERAKLQQGLNAAVGASADRLQHAIDSVRASSDTATVEALRATTDTLATLFQNCAGEYRSLAKAADGHASDVQTLSDAWPQPAPERK